MPFLSYVPMQIHGRNKCEIEMPEKCKRNDFYRREKNSLMAVSAGILSLERFTEIFKRYQIEEYCL